MANRDQFFYPAAKQIVGLLDDVSYRTSSRGVVFSDWLRLTTCALAGGALEGEYLETAKRYDCPGRKDKRCIDLLADAFALLCSAMSNGGDTLNTGKPEKFVDVLGDVFQGGITYGENAQYFTPDPVCDLMARMVTHDNPGARNVFDPCVGSGRMLLAHVNADPIKCGLGNRRLYGQDVDLRCVQITAINLSLWGAHGAVVWGNSLTDECKALYEVGYFSGPDRMARIRYSTPERNPLAPVPPPAYPRPPDPTMTPETQRPISLFSQFE